MDKQACQPWQSAIQSLVAGARDVLAPEQIAGVETHLNTCPLCAAQLAQVTAGPERGLSASVPLPSEQEWESVWGAIEHAQRGAARPHGPGFFRRHARAWPAAAAAVLVLAVALWQFGGGARSEGNALQLAGAGEVDIQSVEVFGDATPMVISAGDNDAPIIWVLDEQEG